MKSLAFRRVSRVTFSWPCYSVLELAASTMSKQELLALLGRSLPVDWAPKL